MITINESICIGCGVCVQDCYPGFLTMAQGRPVAASGRCMGCGHCLAVCPVGAVSLEGADPADILPWEPAMTVAPTPLEVFMRWRRSVRQYQQRPVPRELLAQIIEAGRFAPTGGNRQSLSYLVLTENLPTISWAAIQALRDYARQQPAGGLYQPATFDAMAQAWEQGVDRLLHHAPAVILILDRADGGGVNGGIAASRMELMANALGLGACFVGFLASAVNSSPALKDMLGIAQDQQVVTTLTIGYPAVTYQRTVPRQPAQVNWR